MLELSEVVRDLRSELLRAMEAGHDSALQFEVGGVDLELTIAMKRDGGGKAGVKFFVFELEGNARVESGTTQKLTLRLNPKVSATGDPLTVAGPAVPGEK